MRVVPKWFPGLRDGLLRVARRRQESDADVASLCVRREHLRRMDVVAELLRGSDGERWAIRYLLALIRHDASI